MVQDGSMHKREKDVFFLDTPQEGPFHLMFVKKHHTQEPKESKNYDLESEKKTFEKYCQNATKITSALVDTKHSILQASDIKF